MTTEPAPFTLIAGDNDAPVCEGDACLLPVAEVELPVAEEELPVAEEAAQEPALDVQRG